MSELPSGTVTFLFTDVEGSTALWEHHPDAMRVALARHDKILEGAIDGHGGVVFSRMGDGMAAAFPSAGDALAAAVGAQLGLAKESWPELLGAVTARMGLHSGDGTVVDGEYLSQPLNRCARLMSIGHGGQILVSASTEALVHGRLAEGVDLVDMGEHRLRDLSEPMRVFQVEHPGLRSVFPRLRSLDAFPGNLPLQVSSFVGRQREVARVIAAFDGARVVTLTGVSNKP
jgi:class 3 adenylate cyclase